MQSQQQQQQQQQRPLQQNDFNEIQWRSNIAEVQMYRQNVLT